MDIMINVLLWKLPENMMLTETQKLLVKQLIFNILRDFLFLIFIYLSLSIFYIF